MRRSFGRFRLDISMLPDFETRWRSVPPDALSWRDWGGAVVVFNQETGSTHLLGEFAAAVLLRLAESTDGATVDTLATHVAPDPSDGADGDLKGAIADALSEFARLGLARGEQA